MYSIWRPVSRNRSNLRRLVPLSQLHDIETTLIKICSLYLDVWVPVNATSTSKLPVKVWIYGGGDQAGGIQNAMYDGCNLAAHDTLVVAINYRLGPLGFLALNSAGIAGNFGIEDIILGLEWVQSNIVKFGGNPVRLFRPGCSPRDCN